MCTPAGTLPKRKKTPPRQNTNMGDVAAQSMGRKPVKPVAAKPRKSAFGDIIMQAKGLGPYAKKKKKKGHTSRSTASTGSLRINQT